MTRFAVGLLLSAGLGFAGCSQATPAKSETTAPAPAAVSVGAAAVTAAAAPSADAARIWAVRLYDRYKDDAFSPFKEGARVFDADIERELAEDQRLTPEGEMGAIDADPICSCQDPTDMTARVTAVSLTGPNSARVELNLNWPVPPDLAPEQAPDYTRRTVLHLVMTPDGWRVHDIGDGDDSFLKYLKDQNASRRR